jgi:hypothetical protein
MCGFSKAASTPSLRSTPIGKMLAGETKLWSWRRDLNPRPSDYKSDALPAELRQPEQPWLLLKNDADEQVHDCREYHRAEGVRNWVGEGASAFWGFPSLTGWGGPYLACFLRDVGMSGFLPRTLDQRQKLSGKGLLTSHISQKARDMGHPSLRPGKIPKHCNNVPLREWMLSFLD